MINLKKITNYIDDTVEIEENVKIYPNSYILGNTILKRGTTVYPNCVIVDAVIGENCEIKSSYIEKSEVDCNVKIGPFSNIRPGCKIGSGCKIGNFVEVKNSRIKANTKVAHLAYVGDCEIGENCNIGCGVIFANYNGKIKNKTVVGNNCFIGSNCNVIAPLNIADNCFICAGTTLTKDTKAGDFVIGRAYEICKENKAFEYLNRN